MEAPTQRQMEKVLAVHEFAEFEEDLDATMATVADDPVYEFPALGLRISGRQAVTEMYKRLLPGAKRYNIISDKRHHSIGPSTLCREAFLYFDFDGVRTTGGYMAVVEFEGDKILAERLYMDSSFARVMAEIVGPDFIEVPGVSLLVDTNPPPKARPTDVKDHPAHSYA